MIKFLIKSMIDRGFMQIELSGYKLEFKLRNWFLNNVWSRPEVSKRADVPAAWKEEMLHGLIRKAKAFYEKNTNIAFDSTSDLEGTARKDKWRINKLYKWDLFVGIFQMRHTEIELVYQLTGSETSV
jgi:hypothetical protein